MSRFQETNRGSRYHETLNFEAQFPRSEVFRNGTTSTTSDEEKCQSSSSFSSSSVISRAKKKTVDSSSNSTRDKTRNLSMSSYRPRSPNRGGKAFFNGSNKKSIDSPITEVKPFALSPETRFEGKYGDENDMPIMATIGYDFSLEKKRHEFWDQQEKEDQYCEEEQLKDTDENMSYSEQCAPKPRTLGSGWITNESSENSSERSLSRSSSSADDSTPSTSSSAEEEDEDYVPVRSHSEPREQHDVLDDVPESKMACADDDAIMDAAKDECRQRRRKREKKDKTREKKEKKDRKDRKEKKDRKDKKEKRKRKPHAPAMPHPPSPSLATGESKSITEEESKSCGTPIRPMLDPSSPVESKYDDYSFFETTTTKTITNKDSFNRIKQMKSLLSSNDISSKKQTISMSMINVLRPFKTNQMIHCLLRRSTKGVLGKLTPTYTLYLQDEKWNTIGTMMMIQKKRKSRTPYYAFFDMTKGSVGKQFSKKSGNYLGKLRSNYGGSECTLFGPETVPSGHVAIRFCKNKQDLISKAQGNSDPRAMRVLLPLVEAGEADGTPPCIGTNGDTMLEILQAQADFEETEQLGLNAMRRRRNPDEKKYNDGNEQYSLLGNKLPVFSRGSYRLNFGGRVTLPSVKNFQLVKMSNVIEENMNVDVTNLDDVLLQFGRVGDDDFHLDYRAPMTAFQAMGIVLAQFNF